MDVLMEDMLGSWISACNIVLFVKAKMTYMDSQLSSLDATFAWKCVASGLRRVDTMEVGYGSATGGRSLDKGSTPVSEAATSAPFPISTTIEPLFKCVWDSEGSSNNSSPPPMTNPLTNSEECGWAYPILE